MTTESATLHADLSSFKCNADIMCDASTWQPDNAMLRESVYGYCNVHKHMKHMQSVFEHL